MLLIAAAAAVTGCSLPAGETSIRSDDPLGRAEALAAAVRGGDRSAVPDVIGLLHSEDPAVRMLAIASLEELTGERYGYEVNAPEQAREASIERWRAAWAGGSAGEL